MRAAACRASLCGARGFTPSARWAHDQDVARMHALGVTREPPRWGAPRALLIALPPAPFEAAPGRWAAAALAGSRPEPSGGDDRGAVAWDGKAVRGRLGCHGGPSTCPRRWRRDAA